MTPKTTHLDDLSSSLQDYLEAILVLNHQGKVARVRDIGKLLDVKSASVTGMLKVLAERNLLIHERYGYVELTAEGRRLAGKVLSRHQLLVKFLHEVLGVDRETAVSDACRIEHHLEERTIQKIREFVEKKGGG